MDRVDYLYGQDRRHSNPIICKRAQDEFCCVEVDLTFSSSKEAHNQLLTKKLSSHRQQTGNSELDVVARLTRLLESWSQGAGPTATDRAAPHPGPERGMWRVAGVVGGKS